MDISPDDALIENCVIENSGIENCVCGEQVPQECSSSCHQHTPLKRFTQHHSCKQRPEDCKLDHEDYCNVHCPYVCYKLQNVQVLNEQHPEKCLKEQEDEVYSSEQCYEDSSQPQDKLYTVNNNNDFSIGSAHHPHVCSSHHSPQRCSRNQHSPERRTGHYGLFSRVFLVMLLFLPVVVFSECMDNCMEGYYISATCTPTHNTQCKGK